MPDDPSNASLEALLAYPEPETKDSRRFVDGVMAGVRRAHRMRLLILAVFGAIGALFGLAGGIMLADDINWLFTEALPPMVLMQATLVAVAAVAFYIWAMNDDLPMTR